MNARQNYLVQNSFEKIVPMADTAAALFYGRLFELDPSLRPMFRISLKDQGRKLMQTLAVAVQGLDDLCQLLPTLQVLGRRHAAYGVKPEHYSTVGAALIWMLEKTLGEAFTPEVKEAWMAVYALLAGTMQEAAWPVHRLESPRLQLN